MRFAPSPSPLRRLALAAGLVSDDEDQGPFVGGRLTRFLLGVTAFNVVAAVAFWVMYLSGSSHSGWLLPAIYTLCAVRLLVACARRAADK
jgi:hypothetical protein